MAINDVSLTSGMRSNLLSLQNTVNLLDRTQNRLATGKKVNSAIDNPVSFFASQALNSRASIIDSLKDAMGQAVSTINAADKGITAITSMIEQAKGIAQSAQSAAGATVNVTLTGIEAGAPTSATITVSQQLTNGTTIGIGSTVLTATTAATAGTNEFLVGASTAATATNLQAAVDALDYYEATVSNNIVTITKKDDNGDLTAITTAAGDIFVSSASASEAQVAAVTGGTVALGGVTFTASYSQALVDADTTGLLFYAAGSNTSDASSLASKISANATLSAAGWGASAASNVVTVNRAAYDLKVADFTVSSGAATALTSTDDSELKSLQTRYNTLRTQLSELAEDSGYKGKNLLSSDTLTVKFEGAELAVVGFDASASGLGITAATTWTSGSTIDSDISNLDTALTKLRNESSTMSGNLSIITVRQDFSTNMINTLTGGADKLTLADANEEGANMLMLQTRQSLSTTALSLSAQAAQSVLKLFG